MTEQLREIGGRLAAMRDICGISAAEFAKKCDITPALLEEYEKGKRDFSFSFLYNASKVLSVDIADLMSGESPKLSGCCLTRAGQGYAISRGDAYDYKHLAFTFRDKLAEPFMVAVEPVAAGTPAQNYSHDGQEFIYLLEGRLNFFVDGIPYELSPGDSVYFDAGDPHAIIALDGKPAKFLSVVMK